MPWHLPNERIEQTGPERNRPSVTPSIYNEQAVDFLAGVIKDGQSWATEQAQG